MPEKINGFDCKWKSNDDDHWTMTLISKVEDTEDACVITPEDSPKHELSVRCARRHGFTGKIVASSARSCIEYDEEASGKHLKVFPVNISYSVGEEDNSDEFSPPIFLCGEKAKGMTRDELETILQELEDEEWLELVENLNENTVEHGVDEGEETLKITPKVEIDA